MAYIKNCIGYYEDDINYCEEILENVLENILTDEEIEEIYKNAEIEFKNSLLDYIQNNLDCLDLTNFAISILFSNAKDTINNKYTKYIVDYSINARASYFQVKNIKTGKIA